MPSRPARARALGNEMMPAGVRALHPRGGSQRNREVPRWFGQHPEVRTVFVSELSGAQWLVPRGRDMFAAEVAEYIGAWRELPDSVRHIVVIHDTPKGKP